MGGIISGKIVGAAQITGRVCASSISAGEYTITIDPIEGGYRLRVERGSEVQTIELLDGKPGADGQASYVHIKYSSVPNPASRDEMSDTPQDYIGIYTDNVQEDSDDPTDYTWARIKGEPGLKGDPGEPGQDAPQEAVLYTPQELSAEQQAQARENIAAAGVARLVAVETALAGKLDNAPDTWPEWTEDQQAAARERMGIPGDYELIEEIVCDGEVTNYSRKLEPDGTPYAFRSIYVELEIQPSNVYNGVFFRAYDADGTAVLYDGMITTNKVYTSYAFAGCYAHSGFYCGWMAAANIGESNIGGAANMHINKPQIVLSPIKNILINHNGDVFFDGDKIRIYGVRA